MQPTEQDRLLVSLLTPARLLEFLRGYVLFDRKVQEDRGPLPAVLWNPGVAGTHQPEEARIARR